MNNADLATKAIQDIVKADVNGFIEGYLRAISDLKENGQITEESLTVACDEHQKMIIGLVEACAKSANELVLADIPESIN